MEKYTTTLNYDEIRAWILEHKGIPAIKDEMKGAANSGAKESEGTLTVSFDGNDEYKTISWREFFDRFESERLAFHYRTNAPKEEGWRSFNFINRDFMDAVRDDTTELPEVNEMAKENMFPTEGDAL